MKQKKSTENIDRMTWKEHAALMRRGLKMLHSFDGKVFVMGLVSSAVGAAAPYIPICMSAVLVDLILAGNRLREAAVCAALTVALTFAVSFLRTWLENDLEKRDSRQNYGERWAFAEKAMSLAYQSIEDRETSLLKERIMKDNQTGQNMWRLMNGSERMVSHIIRIVIALLMLSPLLFGGFLSLPAGLLTFAVILVSAVINIVASRAASEHTNRLTDVWARENLVFTHTNEYLQKEGKDMRLYGTGRMIVETNCRRRAASLAVELENSGKTALLMLPSDLFQVLSHTVVYIVLIASAVQGGVSAGSILKYASCLLTLMTAASEAAEDVSYMLYNDRYLKRYFSYFDIPNTMYHGTLTVEKRDDREYHVEFCDVSFRYPNTESWALCHVSMRFRIGEKLAAVGENGSGKTTFIKLLCRLYDPTEGEILLNGVDIRKYDYDEYLKLFSVVFQDYCLFDLTVAQNVAAAVRYDKERMSLCLAQAGLSERIGELSGGADTYVGRGFDESGVLFSGGVKQKIALARALYRDAPFIVLDEPTASLDPAAEYDVYTRFAAIAGDRTAVYVSHRLASCRFCDKIAVFDHGQIVQTGRHEALLAEAGGKYAELWHAQAQYYAQDAEANK